MSKVGKFVQCLCENWKCGNENASSGNEGTPRGASLWSWLDWLLDLAILAKTAYAHVLAFKRTRVGFALRVVYLTLLSSLDYTGYAKCLLSDCRLWMVVALYAVIILIAYLRSVKIIGVRSFVAERPTCDIKVFTKLGTEPETVADSATSGGTSDNDKARKRLFMFENTDGKLDTEVVSKTVEPLEFISERRDQIRTPSTNGRVPVTVVELESCNCSTAAAATNNASQEDEEEKKKTVKMESYFVQELDDLKLRVEGEVFREERPIEASRCRELAANVLQLISTNNEKWSTETNYPSLGSSRSLPPPPQNEPPTAYPKKEDNVPNVTFADIKNVNMNCYFSEDGNTNPRVAFVLGMIAASALHRLAASSLPSGAVTALKSCFGCAWRWPTIPLVEEAVGSL